MALAVPLRGSRFSARRGSALFVRQHYTVRTFAYFFVAVLLVSIVSASAQGTSTNSSIPMRLKIKLFDGWQQTTNADGPATFYRSHSDSPLQISWAEYLGQKPLRKVSTDELKNTAVRFGQKNGFGDLVDSSGGSCAFCSFGTAIFRSATHPRIQVWFVTDEHDYILGTHICSKEPAPIEIREVQDIMSLVTLGPK